MIEPINRGIEVIYQIEEGRFIQNMFLLSKGSALHDPMGIGVSLQHVRFVNT